MVQKSILALTCVMTVASTLYSEEETKLDDTAFNEEQFLSLIHI